MFRPLLLFAGLIGGGSMFLGVASPVSPLRPTPSVSATVDEDATRVAEIAHQETDVTIVLDEQRRTTTVLAVTSQERPRNATHLTVSLDDEQSASCTPLNWDVIAVPEPVSVLSELPPQSQSEFETLLPTSSLDQTWFLPCDASGRDRPILVQTKEIATAARVHVVIDRQLTDDEEFRRGCRQLAARISTVLLPAVEAGFGSTADSLLASDLTVVVTPQVRQMAGGNKPVDAFVLASDFRTELTRPASNECDALYLHPDLLQKPSDPVLVHELVHVVQFRVFRQQYGASPWPLADWVLEGGAHAAEVLLSGNEDNVRDRLNAFAQSPERSPLVVMDSAREGLWREPHCRGATCSFFTWLGRHYGLPAVFQLVVNNPEANEGLPAMLRKTQGELVREWQSSLITKEVVRRYAVGMHAPLEVTIQGGATAFVELPSAGDGRRYSVRIQSRDSSGWAAFLHCTPAKLPESTTEPPVTASLHP